MTTAYSLIKIYTCEAARWHHKSLADAIVQHVHELKITARCIVYRGVAGCYENGEMVSHHIEVISHDMPIKIEIIVPTSDAERVLGELGEMVMDGLVALEELDVRIHRQKT